MAQSPSNHLFVIRVRPEGRLASERLAALGRIQPLEGTDALLLSLPADREAPQAAWRQAQEVVGAAGTVQPVLLDEEGEPHYPTGEISIRFKDALGDAELRRFAARHDLRLLRRNELAPQQAVFQPLDGSGSYLPEIVQRIERQGAAKAVWANTLSCYQRVALR
ncbi:MAG: hypothetical protein ABIS20_25240 [Thermoanaerobaculia bacterium]